MLGMAARILAAPDPSGAGSAVRYNRDIRPILSDHCFQCHGPDKGTRKAHLRLDVREDAVSHGAIIPGDPGQSPLVQRVLSDSPDEQMPPPEAHKPLTNEEKELLRRWIAEGAPYEAHWAYLPIVRPPVPSDPFREDDEPSSPIDAFIRERLEREGLRPAERARPETLLRRLSLDLTGLPPTPEEVAAFLRDPSPEAYAREVERLLASPHFGELMAVPWLDAVRFADTVGYHGDQNQRIFPYRDYVIDSFNSNKPFDQFTIEQIAGDLLPDPTPEQLVATGFNRLNMMTREGGAQPKEYIAKYQADRVRTVSTAWLGSTLACAECHDHKFDPFTTRDFYSMSAFFADIMQWGVYHDYDYTPNPDLRGWSNDHPFPPEIEVENRYLLERLARLTAERERARDAATDRMRRDPEAVEAYLAWQREARAFVEANPEGWSVAPVVSVHSRLGDQPLDHHALESDGSVRFSTNRATHDEITLALPPGWFAALRLELLPESPEAGTLRGEAEFGTVHLAATLRKPDGSEEPLRFGFADSPHREPRYSNTHEILDILGGWRVAATREHPVHGIWLLDQPRSVGEGTQVRVQLSGNPARRVRLAVSPFALEPSRWSDEFAGLRDELTSRAWMPRPRALAAWHESAGRDREATGELRKLASEIRACNDGRAWTMITISTNPIVTRVLPRGNWMDESGPVVEPATPHFLPPPPLPALASAIEDANAPTSTAIEPEADPTALDAPRPGPARENPARRKLTRLDLARWLVSEDNPLTARNMVNRLWAQFFGAGISARIEDLGLQGEWPTHPELLDWLAAEFMRPVTRPVPDAGAPPPHPWDIKHIVRLIVLSETYQQDSNPSSEARERDPDNRLLSHQSPRRLDAEFVRDNALAISGLLHRDIGGPSVFPYQPPDYYANLQFPDRTYIPDDDERQYRRGLYMHWQRTFLHPMLANFDAQSREECVAARLHSNTPQQALTLLNDPTFVEASRAFATLALKSATSDAERIDFLYRRALLREPRGAERESLLRLLEAQRDVYRASPDDAARLVSIGNAPAPADIPAAELAAWANVARVVLNLHETITRY